MLTNTYKLTESEVVLEDDYPVYSSYIYIVDGILRECMVEGTVADLKRSESAREVRRCDLLAHLDAKIGDMVS